MNYELHPNMYSTKFVLVAAVGCVETKTVSEPILALPQQNVSHPLKIAPPKIVQTSVSLCLYVSLLTKSVIFCTIST